MHISAKKVAVAFLAIMVGLILITGLFLITKRPKALYESFRYAQNQRKLLQAIKTADTLMQNDTYGGSTPEETFAMFLDALKAGDTNLASKYFVLSKQEEWENSLDRIEDGDGLLKMVQELERAQSTWTKKEGSPTLVWLEYSVYREEQTIELPNGLKKTLPAGMRRESFTFLLNKESQKWKISQL